MDSIHLYTATERIDAGCLLMSKQDKDPSWKSARWVEERIKIAFQRLGEKSTTSSLSRSTLRHKSLPQGGDEATLITK